MLINCFSIIHSYFIAIQKLGAFDDVEIPIYLGDSAIIPNNVFIDGIDCYSYSINNLKCGTFEIVLPKRFVKLDYFGKIMSTLQAMVKTDNADILYTVFVKHLSIEEKSSEILLSKIRDLAKSLVFLHENKWDGIWIRIATNFMMIARLNSYDLIVGNPPWVKWEHLPAAYTRKIKDFCDVRHIFCNDGGVFGGAQLNICALISNVTASSWLNEDGVLAFLMPDSLMSQNSYEEFRNFYLNEDKSQRLYLQALDRWHAPLRPFRIGKKAVSQDFNTYYYSRDFVDYRKGVPVCNITRKKEYSDEIINNCTHFSNALKFLETIQLDVVRTFFEENQDLMREKIKNILLCLSEVYPKVGYCQGMHHICQFLLEITNNKENDAFNIFSAIISKTSYEQIVIDDFKLMKKFFYVFDRLINIYLPDLYVINKSNNIGACFYISPWFITLFTMRYQKNQTKILLRIFDMFILDGWICIVRIGLIMLKYYQNDLVKMKYEELLQFLINELKDKYDFFGNYNYDKFMEMYREMKIPKGLINNIENEYALMQNIENNK